MKITKRALVGISIGLLIFVSTFVTFYFAFTPRVSDPKQEPVIIWKDEDFRNYAILGDGSIENPYIIEDYNIITDNEYGIFISDTYGNFIIRNCYVNAKNYGIYLDNVANGTAIITQNICTGNEIGIKITYSDNVTIIDNNCYNNLGYTSSGISISDSSNCYIINNSCTFNDVYGIRLENTYSCYLNNNLCSNNSEILDGANIRIVKSQNCSIIHNTCNNGTRGYGIHISVSDFSNIRENIVERNYWAGIFQTSSTNSTIANNILIRNKPWFDRLCHTIWLRYSSYCNLTENIIGSNTGNGIFLESSSHCYVSSNLIYNQTEYDEFHYAEYSTYMGFAVYCLDSDYVSVLSNQGTNNYGSCWAENSDNILISANQWEHDRNYSIEIFEGSNYIIQNNTIDTNKAGICLTHTNSSILRFNEIKNSVSYGLSLYGTSTNNVIHHNSFIDNNQGGFSQAYDEGSGNLWFDNITSAGNFYSDWVSGNYSIDGPSNSVDPYCLTENPLYPMFYIKEVETFSIFTLPKYYQKDQYI